MNIRLRVASATGRMTIYTDRIVIERGAFFLLRKIAEIPMEQVALVQLQKPTPFKGGHLRVVRYQDNKEPISYFAATSDPTTVCFHIHEIGRFENVFETIQAALDGADIAEMLPTYDPRNDQPWWVRPLKFAGAGFLLFVVFGIFIGVLMSNPEIRESAENENVRWQEEQTSSQADPAVISRKQYGKRWPLKVDSARVVYNKPFLLVEVNGILYAVNGTALTYAEQRGWRKIDEIWAPNSEVKGLKMPLSPVFDKSVELFGGP